MSLSEDKAFIRITPAYAGRSDLRLRVHSQDEDHPRVRGEKERQIRISSEGLGSPPRTRGEAGAINAIVEKVRITPAYAGRSASLLPPVCGRGDHPRVRGEKFRKIENGGFDQGSPRVRGEKTKKIPYGRPFSFPAQGISFSLAYSCTILSQSFCAR